MNVKTLTGRTIQTALAEARRLFGDDVVLLESVPPQGSDPAVVRVLADAPLAPRPATAPVSSAAVSSAAASSAAASSAPVFSAPAPVPAFGYAAGARFTPRPAVPETPAAPAAAPAAEPSALDRLRRAAAAPPPAPPAEERHAARPRSAALGRGSLFTGEPAAPAVPAPGEGLEALLEAQLRLLHERLDGLERRSTSALVGTSHTWTAHPLFAALLDRGIRPGTATKLFDALAARGYAPDTEAESLTWALAQELRRLLTVAAPKALTGSVLLVGPSGAGKTSLALRLATDPSFFGRRRTTVVVVGPEDEDERPYLSPVELYRRFSVPVQHVTDAAEMKAALGRVQGFDHVVIDTPPLPRDEGAARRALTRLATLTRAVVPLHVQLVVNATRALEGLDAEHVRRLPLAPDTVALTHLDETDGWGRVAEWMLRLGLPVQFASTGPRLRESLVAFSPGWFVEEMMDLTA